MPALRSLIVILVLCASGQALACEPCVTRSSLERTVKQADVIVLVSNQDRSSESGTSHPEVLELTVEKVLKGNVETSAVLVRSWYGDCAYGAQMRLNGKAILLLQEVTDVTTGEFDGTYKLVEDGCSQGQLEVIGDKVRVNERWQTLGAFESTYLKSSWY